METATKGQTFLAVFPAQCLVPAPQGDEVAQLVSQNALKILMGCGVFDQKAANSFMETHSYNQLVCSSLNIINDMDLIADILFAR